MRAKRVLTDDEKADADRLNSIWRGFKKRHPAVTLKWVSEQCGWGTAGAAEQYISARIALNLSALLRFSRTLSCEPRDISPTLAATLIPMPPAAERHRALVYRMTDATEQRRTEMSSELDLLNGYYIKSMDEGRKIIMATAKREARLAKELGMSSRVNGKKPPLRSV